MPTLRFEGHSDDTFGDAPALAEVAADDGEQHDGYPTEQP